MDGDRRPTSVRPLRPLSLFAVSALAGFFSTAPSCDKSGSGKGPVAGSGGSASGGTSTGGAQGGAGSGAGAGGPQAGSGGNAAAGGTTLGGRAGGSGTSGTGAQSGAAGSETGGTRRTGGGGGIAGDTFACGTETCSSGQFCEMAVSGLPGTPASQFCVTLPTGCQSCDCLCAIASPNNPGPVCGAPYSSCNCRVFVGHLILSCAGA